MVPTTVIFAVVINHEHDLPFEDIVIDEPTRDARKIFRLLHLLELAG